MEGDRMSTFDLETAPNEKEVRRLVKLPEFNPPSKDFDETHPFVLEIIGKATSDKTKGERTDKARAEWDDYVDSALERHRDDCEAVISKALDKAALDPRYSNICAIGVIGDNDSDEPVILCDYEATMLGEFWGMHQAHDILHFYSGNNLSQINELFDYHHLLHRSRVLGVKIPDWAKPVNGRMAHNFVDIAQAYLGTWKFGEYRSANQAAKELSIIGTLDKDELPVTGKDFYKEISFDKELGYVLSDNGYEYLENDLRIEKAIKEAIQL